MGSLLERNCRQGPCRGRSRSPRNAGDPWKACSKEFRDFSKQAAALLTDAMGKLSNRSGAGSGLAKDLDKVRRQMEAVLEMEDEKGKQLALLRSKADDLHGRLRNLAPSPAASGSCAAAAARHPGFAAGQLPPQITAKAGAATPLRGSSALAPWAARRTTRPRLLG
eukprot:TRINITY_DN23527_c0_g1_i1.p1 TRINITY_DN23527_c0_g1~~TRINITY_DN23527_c0_g1_i1.p1  ORF type:complete len:166 (-),score=38.78 TRINITY_DN23527_c0_g1_i1:146-643(-)